MKLARILVVVIGIALLVAAVGCSSTPAEVAPTPNIDATVEARARELVAAQPTATLEATPTARATSTSLPKVRDEPTSPSPTIETINYSSYATTDIREWVERAASKMKNRSSSIFTFIYPVGKEKVSGQTIDRNPFSQH